MFHAHEQQVRAAVYCRISLARLGDTVKVDDQERVSRELATARGWTVATNHVYVDNSQSAWRRDRKRPGWDAMLQAIERNEIDAIIVYHGDRLIRQPWDLELLLRLADEKHIHLASPTGQRDLDNPDDRYILRIEAAGNCREVDATSRRMKRMYERMAENGRTRLGGRGGRAFGYDPDGLTIREPDAAMLREVAQRIIVNRESIGAICRDLNARGYRTTTGGTWSYGGLKKLMCRPRLAGLLERQGRIVGPAAWPPILDRETWETVTELLRHRGSQLAPNPTNLCRYFLSGIALCGTCGQPLVVRQNARDKLPKVRQTNKPRQRLIGYGCTNPDCERKVHRAVHHLDPYVEGYVVHSLQDPRVRERLTTPATRTAVNELAKLEKRRERMLSDFGDDDIMGADVLRVSVRRLDQRIAEARQQVAAQAASHVLDELWGIDRAAWQRLPLSRRRAAVQALIRITVLPSGRRGPGFDPETVLIEDLPLRQS